MSEEEQYTWESIIIKPNDQSLVGEVVKHENWGESDGEILLDVGAKFIIFSESPMWFNIDAHWLIRREVKRLTEHTQACKDMTFYDDCKCLCGHRKKKKVWAHGWVIEEEGDKWILSHKHTKTWFNELYSEAYRFEWPAKMNADGTFEEPDDEE